MDFGLHTEIATKKINFLSTQLQKKRNCINNFKFINRENKETWSTFKTLSEIYKYTLVFLSNRRPDLNKRPGGKLSKSNKRPGLIKCPGNTFL